MAKKKTKKKAKKLTKLQLQWQNKSKMINCMKRQFSRSPVVQECLKAVRSEEPRYKNDGSRAKVDKVLFKCNHCKEKFMGTQVQCDHIEPIVPVQIPGKHMDMVQILWRTNVDIDQLQILCKPCHKIKSQEENKQRRDWKNKMKHCVYTTTNMKNGKMYIGIHSTVDMDDGYLGSGSKLKEDIKKYGKDDFIKQVMHVFDTREEAFACEHDIVTQGIVEDPAFYNQIVGGKGCTMTDEIKEKISKTKKERGKLKGEKNPNYGGKCFTDEIKAKIGDRYYPTGSEHPKAKQVICVETQQVFDSIKDASEYFGGAIQEKKSAYGYRWQYGNTIDPNIIYDRPIKNAFRPVRCVETNITYASLSDAARSIGLLQGSKIGEVCRGKRKSAGNCTWEFIEINQIGE